MQRCCRTASAAEGDEARYTTLNDQTWARLEMIVDLTLIDPDGALLPDL